MEHTTVFIETFGCVCEYKLEIDQHPDYPKVNPMTESFYIERGWAVRGIPVGKCPNCFRKGISNDLGRIIDPNKQSRMQIKTPEQVQVETKPMVDSDGRIVAIQTGVEEKKMIQGDEIVTEQVPVMEVKQRGLTTKEKQEETEKIHKAEDKAALMEATAS